MNFILYYLLRRFFVSLSFEGDIIHLEKGLILRRVSDIPFSRAVLCEIRRSPLLRILGGKHVTIVTHSGKISFYMKRGERLPFLPRRSGAIIRPSRFRIVCGAFEGTRAFGGTFTFAAAISRVGSVLGSEYSEKITSALELAADSVFETLSAVNIAVPRIAAVIAVFLIAAWLFAFVRKYIMLSRFALSAKKGFVTVRHGLITLYESTLVLNNINAVISRRAVTGTLGGIAGVYCMDRLIFPPIKNGERKRLLKSVFGLECPDSAPIKPPFGAVFAYCGVPFWWFFGSAAALFAVYLAERYTVIPPLPLIRSALWFAAVISLYNVFTRALYMSRCGIMTKDGVCELSCIKKSRLCTADIPLEKIVSRKTRRTRFSEKSGLSALSDLYLGIYGEKRFMLRKVPLLLDDRR